MISRCLLWMRNEMKFQNAGKMQAGRQAGRQDLE
jgi:hypothetical protein